jgi:hypothetical protein
MDIDLNQDYLRFVLELIACRPCGGGCAVDPDQSGAARLKRFGPNSL